MGNSAAWVTRSWVLPDMHCVQCVSSLEKLPEWLDGVWRSEVDFSRKTIQVQFNPQEIASDALEEQLRKMGFPPLLQSAEKAAKTRAMRPLIGRLAVAGFVFGNVMMMSLADYLGGASFRASGFVDGFKLWSMVLTLPVLFYSAAPFFKKAWTGLRQGALNLDVPVVMGIVTLTIQSVMMEGLGYFDSLSGLVFFLLLGRWYQSERQAKLFQEHTLEAWLPFKVTQKGPEGGLALIPISAIEQGMTLRIHHGEVLPADGVLVGKKPALVDKAFLTGESWPVAVLTGEPLMAGTRNTGAAIEMRVLKSVSQSELMQMWNSDAFQKDMRSSLSSPIDRIAKHFTWVVLLLAFAGWWAWWPNVEMAWRVFASVLIVACPCALALSVPFAYGATAKHMGALGFFLKHVDVVERFASLKHLVFDKTGTLTASQDFSVEWSPQAKVAPDAMRALAVLTSQSAHPISRALFAWVDQTTDDAELLDFKEHPGKGVEGRWKGAQWRLGSTDFVRLKAHNEGSKSRVHLFRNDVHQGSFSLTRPLRPGMSEQLSSLAEGGCEVHLLSGDSPEERGRFSRWFALDHMHFRQTPAQKMAHIESLSREGVAMVGDGLNDAGALKKATLGLAVVDQLHAFSPASDALVEAHSLSRLPEAIRLAKQGRKTVVILLGVSVLYNGVGMVFALQGWLTPLVAAVLMPLSSLTVVMVALGRAGLSASKLMQVSSNTAKR